MTFFAYPKRNPKEATLKTPQQPEMGIYHLTKEIEP